MLKHNRFLLLLVAFMFTSVLVITSCDTDLNVTNWNTPDRKRALSSAEDVEGLIGGAFYSSWIGSMWANPQMAFSTMADENTCSWGNWGMREMSSEPRIAIPNTTTWGYRPMMTTPWDYSYRAISSANDGLLSLMDPDVIEAFETADLDINRAKAFAKWVQGYSHGFLALYFDKAFIFDETADLDEGLEWSPYNEVMTAAIGYLNECITICNANNFTLPVTWVRGVDGVTNVELAKYCHQFIASFMMDVARTPAERDAADWTTIKSHIQQGITEEWGPWGEVGTNWYAYMYTYGQKEGWNRVDNNTIGRADESGNYQSWLDTNLLDRREFLVYTNDKRITPAYDSPEDPGLYFQYHGDPPHSPDRGTYHFSFYHWYRMEPYDLDRSLRMVYYSMERKNLDLAEAEFRLGNKQACADIINQTRVTYGGLPAISADDPKLWDVLTYEKQIQCYLRKPGTAFVEDRGWGLLLEGTPFHMPVPAAELELLELDTYTFGGSGDYTAPTGSHPWTVAYGPNLPKMKVIAPGPFELIPKH